MLGAFSSTNSREQGNGVLSNLVVFLAFLGLDDVLDQLEEVNLVANWIGLFEGG
jgi:hypothetical protein